MLFREFRCKEVINIRDCKNLGRVVDFEFDECRGCICKLFVREKLCCCNLFKSEAQVTVNYNEIKQIGPDIILVDVKI